MTSERQEQEAETPAAVFDTIAIQESWNPERLIAFGSRLDVVVGIINRWIHFVLGEGGAYYE